MVDLRQSCASKSETACGRERAKDFLKIVPSRCPASLARRLLQLQRHAKWLQRNDESSLDG